MHPQPPTDPQLPGTPARHSARAALSKSSLAVSIGFAVAAAAMISPIFVTPIWVLLGRTLFVSMGCLLVFVATQRLPERWLPRWLPRWLLAVLAVALAAPLGTFMVYLLSVGGRVTDFTSSEPRLTGFFVISCVALGLGLLITLTAQLREREARSRSLALELELQRSRLEKQAVDARLALLQGQIEPHFLFNTLANVQALVETGSPRAAEVLKSLIAYLRAAMPRLHDSEPTLDNELALVRAYLELMRMRLPDRLSYSLRVDDALHAMALPSMSLLTLAENAVRHGIDPAEDGGTIEVGAERVGSVTRLWVADSGAGMHEHAQTGTGLANLRARLAATYGAAAELVLSEVRPHGLRAEIVITS